VVSPVKLVVLGGEEGGFAWFWCGFRELGCLLQVLTLVPPSHFAYVPCICSFVSLQVATPSALDYFASRYSPRGLTVAILLPFFYT